MQQAKYAHLVGKAVKFAHPAGEVRGKVVKVHSSTLHVQVQTVSGYPGATVRFNHRPERNNWVQVGRTVGPVLYFVDGQ